MNSQPISRARLAGRLVVNMILAPAILVALVIGVCWLAVTIGII